jgi:hypothetical protein
MHHVGVLGEALITLAERFEQCIKDRLGGLWLLKQAPRITPKTANSYSPLRN